MTDHVIGVQRGASRGDAGSPAEAAGNGASGAPQGVAGAVVSNGGVGGEAMGASGTTSSPVVDSAGAAGRTIVGAGSDPGITVTSGGNGGTGTAPTTDGNQGGSGGAGDLLLEVALPTLGPTAQWDCIGLVDPGAPCSLSGGRSATLLPAGGCPVEPERPTKPIDCASASMACWLAVTQAGELAYINCVCQGEGNCSSIANSYTHTWGDGFAVCQCAEPGKGE